MNTFRKGIRLSLSLLTVVMLMAVYMTTPASADANPNPRVIPNKGTLYADLSVKWWKWAIDQKEDIADIPYFNPGGPVDISAGQSGEVWFLAGAAVGFGDPPVPAQVTRIGTIPAGKSLFFPMGNLVNDWPCPDPTFKPDPGETMEQFLQRTGKFYLDQYFVPDPSQLFAEVDGVPLTNLSAYKAVSPMFMFTGTSTLADINYDTCITGSLQPGVSVGYWLWLAPLPPGQHTLHFGVPSMAQDITYILTVK